MFVVPIAKEVDLKAAARAVGEKSVEMIHVKDITKITGYVRGGCSPLGMKKNYTTVVLIVKYLNTLTQTTKLLKWIMLRLRET